MLREHHRVFQSAQVLRDTLVAIAAFGLAYLVRFHTDVLPFDSPANKEESVVMGLMVACVWPAVAWISNLYVSHRTRPLIGEVFDVFKASLLCFLLIVTITYFLREERYSRSVVGLWVVFSFVLVSAVRIVSRLMMGRLRARGYNLRHVAVIGAGDLARRVVEVTRVRSAMGLRAVGVIVPGDHDASFDNAALELGGAPILGTTAELGDILRRHREEGHGIDQVIVALPIEGLGALKDIMQTLSQETVDVRLIPDVYQFITLCGSLEDFAGLPLINLQSTPLVGWNWVAKRLFDVAFAGLGLVLASPLLVLVAAAVKLTSRGPVFFRQVRVGVDGTTFNMFKFRTMVTDAEAAGAKMTAAGNPRRTLVGRVLRRASIDELPQLFNVLRGDMSLVGPRPEQPDFIDDFVRAIPRYALRHKIKSGMTGLAQVNGMRGNTSMRRRIELDLYYIENWSLLLDFKILMRTVLGGFLSPNAY